MSSQNLLITQFLKEHSEVALREISEYSSAEIADLITALEQPYQVIILSGLTSRKAAKVIEKIPTDGQKALLGELSFAVLESIFRSMDIPSRNNLLPLLPVDLSVPLKRSLAYDKNRVGAYVNPQVPTLTGELSAENALQILRSDRDTGYFQVFVLSTGKELNGVVDTTSLIRTDPKKSIKKIIKPITAKLTAEMRVKEVLENWDDRFFELPVTDIKNRFLGIVTRELLTNGASQKAEADQSVIKAGNALADLYLIGLTSLFGHSDSTTH
jgi:Mg/Co/Ni transporter MgtE